jgi:hypothetical protein
MTENVMATIAEKAVATKRDAAELCVESEGSSVLSLLAQLKQSVGDLALFDDITVEAEVDQAGPRAKSHFRFRCYRRSGG